MGVLWIAISQPTTYGLTAGREERSTPDLVEYRMKRCRLEIITRQARVQDNWVSKGVNCQPRSVDAGDVAK